MLEGKGGEPVPSNKFFLHLYIVKIQNMIYTYIKNSSSSGRKTMEKKKFKDLTIRDAFLFAAVMTDREICRKLLELSLEITIASVQVQTEKTMAYHSEYHGVRLDVYAAYEIQCRNAGSPSGLSAQKKQILSRTAGYGCSACRRIL